MPPDDRPPRPAAASAPSSIYGYGADFNTRNSLHALGIPADAPWVRLRSETFVTGRQTALFTVDGAIHQTFEWAPDSEQRAAWNGHALEVLGVVHGPFDGSGPFWLLTGADGAERHVQVWHYRILVSGTPLSVQLTIGHGTGQQRRGSIEGLELEHLPADTRRSAAAEALLWRLEDPRHISPAEAQRRLRHAVDVVLTDRETCPHPPNLKREHLAEALGCTEQTISNYLKRAGDGWSMSAVKSSYTARYQEIGS